MKTFRPGSGEVLEWYLDLRKSKLLLRAFVDDYNEGKPLRERLRPNHMAFGVELLELYRMSLWRCQSAGAFLIPDAPLPYLETNNVQLSQRMLCTERSIQHWRERLKAAGLILEEVWHGSNAGYEIALNPAILYITRRGDGRRLGAGSLERGAGGVEHGVRDQGVTAVWKSGRSDVEIGPERQREQGSEETRYGENNAVFTKKFSPYCTLYLLDTNQLNQLEVDRCGNRAGADEDRAGEQRRNFLTGYETDSDIRIKPPRVARHPPTSPLPPLSFGHFPLGGKTEDGAVEGMKKEIVAPLEQAGAESQGRESEAGTEEETGKCAVPETFGEVVQELPERLGRRIFREVSKVWEVALEELYAEDWIADSERERAKARLAEYYIYADPKRYAAGTAEICERIRLVRKWIDRGRVQSPTLSRWVPIPSAYFDFRNGRGFTRTKGWYKEHMAKRQEIGDRIAVAKAVRRYQRCVDGEDDSMGPVELYRFLAGRLAERGNDVVHQFRDAVIMG